MDIRVGQCAVIVQTINTLYKQQVEYCCGSLLSSLMNTQLVSPLDISSVRFTCCAAIGHWSSSYHNTGPNKLTWSHIKKIIRSKECIIRFIDITNAYIKLGHWPYHFKTSITAIISKLNKALYNTPKYF